LNPELAKRKGWNNTIVKLINHCDLHWKLWESFEQVVKHCRRVGATVLIEWPRFCSYWHSQRVSQFLKVMKFKHTDFDGCMYGLVSRREGTYGLPVRKPWRIAFINSSMDKHLHVLCDGSHPHAPCNGIDAIYSHGYTLAICHAIMKSVQDGKIHSSQVVTL